MDWEQQITLWLWKASIGLEAVLCVRLAGSGLLRSYPYFFGYIAALAAESILLIVADQSRDLYQQVYLVTRIVLLPIEIAAVLEIFNRWSDSFRGIGKFGKQLLLVLLVLAAGVCLSTVPIDRSLPGGWVLPVYVMTVANRAVQTGLAAFLILMLIFYTKFGGPVARNLKLHTWAMTAFVVANSLGYFLIASSFNEIGNVVLQAISTGSLIFWIAALTSSGQTPPETPKNPEAWAEAEAMNRQLMEFASSVKQTRREAGTKK